MLFRGTLTNPPKAATRGKNISNRTYKKIQPGLKPVAIIDATYIAYLLESKASHKISKIYKIFDNEVLIKAILYNKTNRLSLQDKYIYNELRTVIYTILTNIINKSKTNTIVVVYNSSEHLCKTINSSLILKSILKPFKFQDVLLEPGQRYCDYVYTLCKSQSSNLSNNLLIYVTNSITTWSCASNRLHHACILISKDNRAILYSEKTGLDILSRFIGTLHIINKLNLDECKNVNLQYLYILIMFIRFLTESKHSAQYFFDSLYYKEFKNTERTDFVGKEGLGYKLVAQANKTISYFFFTREESLDRFLFLQPIEFQQYLSGLQKSLDFDVDLMTYFQSYYLRIDKIKQLTEIDELEVKVNKRVSKPNDVIFNKVITLLNKYNTYNNNNRIVKVSKDDMDSVAKMLQDLFRV